jgi:hypothetical protein
MEISNVCRVMMYISMFFIARSSSIDRSTIFNSRILCNKYVH